MSRYIENAHILFSSVSALTAPLRAGEDGPPSLPGVLPTGRQRTRVASTAVGAGRGVRQAVAFPYNSLVARLAKVRDAISRHERNLALARTSVSEGSASRGMILQLTRRLHQAREEPSLLGSDRAAAGLAAHL